MDKETDIDATPDIVHEIARDKVPWKNDYLFLKGISAKSHMILCSHYNRYGMENILHLCYNTNIVEFTEWLTIKSQGLSSKKVLCLKMGAEK